MQDCNHLLVPRGWKKATGDDEEEVRTEKVERDKGKTDGQGEGEKRGKARERRARTKGGEGNEGKKRRDDAISIR